MNFGIRFLIATSTIAILTSSALSQDLKKVKIGVGTQVIDVTYPWLTMPKALGWWRDEGLDVTLVPVSGSLQATQLLAAGSLDFAEMNTAAIIQANVTSDIPLRVVMTNTVVDWSIVSLEGGSIKSPADLKGTTVGVLSLASSGIALLKAYLAHNGLDPEKDVKFVATGAGASALQALNSGRVQALMFWGAMNASFENQGVKLRYFHLDEWRKMPDFTLASTEQVIKADPGLVQKIAVGIAKGSAFAFISPNCTREVHWSAYPDSKPSGAPDAATAIAWDDNNLKASMVSMKEAFDAGGGKLWGSTTAEGMKLVQDFMLQSHQIKASKDPGSYLVSLPQFWESVNSFDDAKLRDVAAACPAK